MFIKKLDLLSSSPQMYYQQKRTNKTFFGGVLFLIFITISILVSVVHVINFCLKDKYEITYTLYKDFTVDDIESNKIEELNPHLNFTFEFKKLSESFESLEIEEQFTLYDDNFNELKNNITINKTPSEMSLYVLKTRAIDCNKDEKNNTNDIFILNLTYSGYKIDHKNKKNPLERNSDKYTFYKEFFFTLEGSSFYEVSWGVIKYKEEKGLSGLLDELKGKKNEFTAIDIDSINQMNLQNPIQDIEDIGLYNMCIVYHLPIIIHMNNDHKQYMEYKRVKKSVLEVFTNIGALFSTLYSIFSFVFSFYSINFDNYKLVKEIFLFSSLNSKRNTFKSTLVSFDDTILKNRPWESYEVCSSDNKKTITQDNKEVNELKKNQKQITLTEAQTIGGFASRIKFIYFFLENICCKREKMKKEFRIINICNDIISKYISIDNILYNQIVFENLLNDYIWNDNNLKMIENYNLLKKLKLELNLN